MGLALLGCLAVYNATFFLAAPYHFVTRQAAWLGVAVVGFVLAAGVPVAWYRRWAPWLAAGAWALLAAVLRWGTEVNGMTGWFSYRGIFFQPSEFGKPVFVLAVVWGLERFQMRRGGLDWRAFLAMLGGFAVWIGPIGLEPDFGAVLVYALAFGILLWNAGARLEHCLLLGALGLVGTVAVLAREPYVFKRFHIFFLPGPGSPAWQVQQFQYALASGGWLGRWWGHGLWTRAYLPLGYSDSIFAAVGEAVGLVGVIPLVLLIPAWVAYGFRLCLRAGAGFGGAAAFGLCVLTGVQALVHLAVNTGLIPPTGVTLPLISYGGSSLVATFVSLGIVERVRREARRSGAPAALA